MAERASETALAADVVQEALLAVVTTGDREKLLKRIAKVEARAYALRPKGDDAFNVVSIWDRRRKADPAFVERQRHNEVVASAILSACTSLRMRLQRV